MREWRGARRVLEKSACKGMGSWSLVAFTAPHELNCTQVGPSPSKLLRSREALCCIELRDLNLGLLLIGGRHKFANDQILKNKINSSYLNDAFCSFLCLRNGFIFLPYVPTQFYQSSHPHWPKSRAWPYILKK